MKLGHHILTSYGFTTTVDHAHKTGADIFQMFLGSPKSFKIVHRKNEDLQKIKEKAELYKINIVIHGNYLMNYCNPSTSFIHKTSVKLLVNDLVDSVKLGAIGVVIHMGKNTEKLQITDDEAKKNYIDGVESALESSPERSIVILETGAGQGKEIFTSLYGLGQLRNMINEKFRHRVKFCIDTCHIFSSGYDLGNKDYVRMLELHIDNTLGWNNVSVVHLNDSKEVLNCRVDRHADIGKGCINIIGLMEFVKLCNKYNVPMVLETPSNTYNDKRFTSTDQMKFIRDYIKKN